MGTTRLFLCLTVIAGTLAKSEDGSDLNLKSIFRTPRDFSRVNFDHFELLERNNFNDEDKESHAEKKEIARSDDRLSRSSANAQVMLRIGGEDIHDCNRVILHDPPTIKENNYYSEQPQQPQQQQVYNNDARYQYYPHPYSSYPYVHHPISFPGYYYNPNPLQNYLHSSYQPVTNQLVQNEFATKSQHGTTTLTYIEDGSNSLPTTERLVEVSTEEPNPQVILEKPSSYDTQIRTTQTVHLPSEHVEEKTFVTNPEPVRHAVVETTYASSAEEHTTQEPTTSSPICVTTPHPEPSHTKVEHVEVNLVTTEKPCVESKEDVHLVEDVEPLSSEKTQQSVVVSHPEAHVQEQTISTTPEQQVVVSQASSDSCNRGRDSNIAYGHRFSKDVDSLHEIVDNGLYNEERSVRVTNVETPLEQRNLETVSTSVPANDDSHSQTLVHNVVTYPKDEVVQVVNHEPVEQRYVTQEVVQHSAPQTITKIESPRETNTVITEERQFQPSVELSSHNVRVQPSSSTQPEYTQELVRVSNPQSSQSRVVETTHESPYTREVLQEVSRVLPEVVESSGLKEVRVQSPEVLLKGYNSKDNSQVSIDLTRYGNERPKVIIEDYEARGRSGYNSVPIRSIIYRQPLVLDSFRSSNPPISVLERVRYIEPYRELVDTSPIREHVRIVNPFSSFLESYRSSPVKYVHPHHRISEPHIYKIVPKFDIIPRRDIRPLHIPDLVPTNQFLKVNVPHRQVYRREYVHVDKTPVTRHEYQVRKSPHFWKNISVQKEVQSAPVCKPCSRYSAELDELY